MIGKLGKLEAVHDPRTLRIARYMTPDLPPPPDMVDWHAGVDDFGMKLNDQLGDCTCATAAHMIEIFGAANGREIVIPDASVLRAYQDVGGYVPGRPETDQGAYVLDLLRYWRTDGFVDENGTVHKILGFAAVDLKDELQVMQSIAIFGGIYWGFGLPRSIDRQETWSIDLGADGAKIGSLGGHATSSHSYRRGVGLECVTWARRQPMTWPWAYGYADEAFVVVSEDWADSDGAPNGLDKDRLLSDLARFN